MKNYTKVIQSTLAANAFATPDHVFKALLDAYNEKNFYAKRTHTFLVTRLIHLINAQKNNSNQEKIKAVAQQINTLTPAVLNKKGDMAHLLKAFLSYYPDYYEFVDKDVINHVSPAAYGLSDQMAMAEFEKIKEILKLIETEEDMYFSWDAINEKTTFRKTIICMEALVKLAKVSNTARPAMIDFLLTKMISGSYYFNAAIQNGIVALSADLSAKQLENVVYNLHENHLNTLTELKSVMPPHLISVLLNRTILMLEKARQSADTPRDKATIEMLLAYLPLAPKATHKELLMRIIQLIKTQSMVFSTLDLNCLLVELLKLVEPNVIAQIFTALDFNSESFDNTDETNESATVLRLMVPYLNEQQKMTALTALVGTMENTDPLTEVISYELVICLEQLFEDAPMHWKNRIILRTARYLPAEIVLFKNNGIEYMIHLTEELIEEYYQTKSFQSLLNFNFDTLPAINRDTLINGIFQKLETNHERSHEVARLRYQNIQFLEQHSQHIQDSQVERAILLLMPILREYVHHVNANNIERDWAIDRSNVIVLALMTITKLAKRIPATLINIVGSQLINMTSRFDLETMTVPTMWSFQTIDAIEAIYPFVTDEVIAKTLANKIIHHRFKFHESSEVLEKLIKNHPERVPSFAHQRKYIDKLISDVYLPHIGVKESKYEERHLSFFKLLAKYAPQALSRHLFEGLIEDFHKKFYLNATKPENPTWTIKLIECVYPLLPQDLKKKLIAIFFNEIAACNNHKKVFKPIARLIISDQDYCHMKANFVSIQPMQLPDLGYAPMEILTELYEESKDKIIREFLRDNLNVVSRENKFELVDIVESYTAPRKV